MDYEKRFERFELDYLEAKREAEEATKREEDEWNSEIERMKQNYSAFLVAAEQANEMERQNRRVLQENRDQLNERKNSLQKQLREWYDNGPLYPSFQNMVAVTQIFDYIASGIATELEGPNGAYSQYMNDVRTAKICDNIETLRKDLLQGFEALGEIQYMMVEELRQSNEKLVDVDNSIQFMNDDVIDYMSDLRSIAKDSNNYMNDMSGKLAAMEKNTTAIGSMTYNLVGISEDIRSSSQVTALNSSMVRLNQYLDMKSRGIDGYW